ncbi:MAG: hypothetical protein G8345_14475 [Magnetococcales bacterium]|nr:hypothetical protein [Magnetococcales bacterium]NGZ28081.1 hypothetical protein [Magnetococcales bacterium]
MRKGAFWLLLALSLPLSAHAELYCAVNFAGKNCWYNDMASCRKAAGPQGDCVLNSDKMQAPVGGAPICMVESWQTQCIYQDLASCGKVAVSRRAECIRNPNYR